MTRDEIIKGLEKEIRRIHREPKRKMLGIFMTVDEAEDIVVLLKEQEAKPMTLEDVKAFDWDYCYLEEERLPEKGYRAVCGDYALTCITWPCVTSMRIQHGDDSYGKKWRCWSAKPTDEQRQAVKWE